MKLQTTLIAGAISAFILTACEREPQVKQQLELTPAIKTDSASADTVDAIAATNKLFEDFFQEHLDRNPVFQTFLGIKKDYGKWDNLSPEFALQTHHIKQRQLKQLQAINPAQLDEATRLSLNLAIADLKQDIEGYKWRLHNYPVNQMFGTHSEVPSLLMNQHRIDSVEDAEAYIARLNALPQYFGQLIENLKTRAKAGIIAPKFVFAYVIGDSQNLINGAPFTSGKDSALFADFKGKVNKLKLDGSKKTALINQARDAL
ncbi:MAG: DUF885 domain-containing protein, partial [Gammaproteobacteria bacterium]|nr:DUF885 domain-containing protein [Gammaproteobacteria bacterium]